jgi:hypothetical protein
LDAESRAVTGSPSRHRVDYFHLALNANGTKYEERVNDLSWNGEWEAAVAREPYAWTAEIAVPLASLGVLPPQKGTKWRANFCRNRMTDGDPELSSWSATYGSYHTPVRFGTLTFQGKGK